MQWILVYKQIKNSSNQKSVEYRDAINNKEARQG